MQRTKATETPVTIVVAWVDMSGLEKTGRMILRDMNWFPEFKAVPAAKTCIWLNRGNAEDIAKAHAYAAPRGYFVFLYEPETKNARERASSEVLKQWNALTTAEQVARIEQHERMA